ncbi:hypothetical protein SEA_APHELION_141 [Gordonia phage Aphelion]|uniref:Uncharacterized protein n=1 Tax=Gordonia phage Aphelion TaxID=2507860 RepID=A0A410TDA1_9CAUD|nr:hypothetical protein SEA_APHELION_141 [Gordonia phage Aphelion]WKW85938.1 hypothetical protein SEA_PHINKBODEN_139 [Gordonia Phage PhinkBoden]
MSNKKLKKRIKVLETELDELRRRIVALEAGGSPKSEFPPYRQWFDAGVESGLLGPVISALKDSARR